MEYRFLGRTGVRVSQLCFGTMSFGAEADEQTSAAMYRRCRELGINFFDTANVYSQGRSEEILGRLIQGERHELMLTSKVCSAMGKGPNDRGLSRRHIALQVEASLKRLGTDRLDLYFIHNFDPHTPMEETLRAFDDLVHQGKILYPAVSNWAAWQIALALGISAREGLARFACIQPMYSLVKRQVEVEILPLARHEQLGVIPYSPLGAGLLTGKYGMGRKPAVGRLLEKANYAVRYGDAAYYEVAERFAAYAKEKGVHPATLGVAWVMAHPDITAPIIGARSLEQLEPSLQAARFDMSPQMRAEISALSPEPPPATDRTDDRSSPP
jgi:aryl-alcohol dehydrogenase-like predicted oxidoreductase